MRAPDALPRKECLRLAWLDVRSQIFWIATLVPIITVGVMYLTIKPDPHVSLLWLYSMMGLLMEGVSLSLILFMFLTRYGYFMDRETPSQKKERELRTLAALKARNPEQDDIKRMLLHILGEYPTDKLTYAPTDHNLLQLGKSIYSCGEMLEEIENVTDVAKQYFRDIMRGGRDLLSDQASNSASHRQSGEFFA